MFDWTIFANLIFGVFDQFDFWLRETVVKRLILDLLLTVLELVWLDLQGRTGLFLQILGHFASFFCLPAVDTVISIVFYLLSRLGLALSRIPSLPQNHLLHALPLIRVDCSMVFSEKTFKSFIETRLTILTLGSPELFQGHFFIVDLFLSWLKVRTGEKPRVNHEIRVEDLAVILWVSLKGLLCLLL